jgi:hypothetical protein
MKTEVKCQLSDDTNHTYYPSVECGPLDVSKAFHNLGWKASDWVEN